RYRRRAAQHLARAPLQPAEQRRFRSSPAPSHERPSQRRLLGGNLKSIRNTLAVVITVLLGMTSIAGARVVFETSEFSVGQFRAIDEALATCEGDADPFICRYEDETLTRIPTKGADFFFTPAGEMAAAFVKVQRGQTLNDYSINARNNLIPMDALVP